MNQPASQRPPALVTYPKAAALFLPWTLLLCCLLCPHAARAADALLPKYSRFEQAFQSSASYANPARDASLLVTFTSPKGDTFTVPGFWDGNQTWRVRFAPTQEGRWKFASRCSDASNKGLHQQTGEFTVGAAATTSGLAKHGPLALAPGGRYLMHHDGTPFFWLADTAWSGPLLSTSADWEQYVRERARQRFTAVQWAATPFGAAPDGDEKKQAAYTGREQIQINPAFFQRMDERVDALTKAGIVSVPALLWAREGGVNTSANPGVSLPESEAILLARYIVARWGGNPVAWILGADGDFQNDSAEKWKRIGHAVFDDIAHAPVTMLPTAMKFAWKEFIDEAWYGFVGYQVGQHDHEQSLRWLQEGPPTDYWTRLPHRPFINLGGAYEDYTAIESRKRFSAEAVRHHAYWSLLCTPTAGLTYGAHGVWGWDNGTKAPAEHPESGVPLPWQRAMGLPGAEQMTHVINFFSSIEWWRLRPAPVVVVNNSGAATPVTYVAGSKTDEKDLMVVYVPADRTLEVQLDSMPPSPNVTWINPLTGERSAAVAVVTASTCQFPTPAEGDWILMMKTEKKDATKASPPPASTAPPSNFDPSRIIPGRANPSIPSSPADKK